MKKAWIENGKVRDICNGDPSECFHPDIAIYYDTEVADDVAIGAELINGVWVNPEIVQPETPTQTVEEVSPVEFKLLFTVHERIAIKNSQDEIVKDFMDIVNDPKLTKVVLTLQSTKDALNYMQTINLLEVGRVDEILSGKIL